MISDGIIVGAKAVYPSSFIYRGIFSFESMREIKKFCDVKPMRMYTDGTCDYIIRYREESEIVNTDEQNQYNQGVDDVVQAIKDLVNENPSDCFAQIVSDLDQIASDLKECDA